VCPEITEQAGFAADEPSRPPRSCGIAGAGCGSGAFTIGTAKLGYKSLGLSWDVRNQKVAERRARIARAKTASFQICDVRQLEEKEDLRGEFDVVVCTETIEHIIDDFRLMRMDYGPFPDFEDGRHVHRG
jgi:2-polyprenyl-3-methyl-5-hydroxy-6-metoxy-1,4-benzoquinol methylase